MRQKMSEKNVRKYRKLYPDLDIYMILVRGGTGHRKDLCCKDGTIFNLWPDGTLTKDECICAKYKEPENDE